MLYGLPLVNPSPHLECPQALLQVSIHGPHLERAEQSILDRLRLVVISCSACRHGSGPTHQMQRLVVLPVGVCGGGGGLGKNGIVYCM